MKTHKKAAVSLLVQMTQYIAHKGIDPVLLMANVGIDPVILESPDNWISTQQLDDLGARAVQATGDRFFGLHVGERASTSSWSILGYIWMNCQTLGEGLDRTRQYKDVVGGTVEVCVEMEADQILMVVKNLTGPPIQNRHTSDNVLASFVTIFKLLTHNRFSLTEVRFQYPILEDISEYQRIFNCSLRFNRETTALVFHRSELETPIVYSNPDILHIFEKHAENLLERLGRKKVYTRETGQLIVENLKGSAPNIKELSAKMAMSVRSLQLKLRGEGTTYTKIVENVRKELAQSYLSEGNHSVAEISFLLGYSEPCVFSRVFKNWVGATPHQYRANQ